MKDIIIIDSNNLAYEAAYTLGGLSVEEIPTGVIFGFMNTVLRLSQEFNTNQFIFCWDSRNSKRKEGYSAYKKSRRDYDSDEEAEMWEMVFNQFTFLRKDFLPELGFKNVFMFDGYESDDIIAWIVQKFAREFIVYSSDNDLFQLLDDCTLYRQKELFTKKDFEEKYGIKPSQWSLAKAIGGCRGDDVEGVDKIGDPGKSVKSMALKYIRGELTKGVVYDRIKASQDIIDRNLKLVKLPYRSLLRQHIQLREDKLDVDRFIYYFSLFRFMSFLDDKRWKKWEKFIDG